MPNTVIFLTTKIVSLQIYILILGCDISTCKPGLRPSGAQGPIHGCGPPSIKTIL